MTDYLFLSRYAAKLSASLFAGSAVYCTLVEHPARLQCGVNLASTVFPASFYKAAKLQSSLAITSGFAAIAAFQLDKIKDRSWLFCGLAMLSIMPYTYIFLMPVNRKLLAPNVDKNSDETNSLLEKWGQLHAVRSFIGFVCSAIMLYHC